jgi:MYXO-CTERM domain-containing protein
MKPLVLHFSLVALAATSTLAISEHPARACGGCFNLIKSAGTESTVVTDHRMAFSVSTQQTVLWDQIKYSGNPSEFSWVLPVHAGAVVQLSHDEWFASLDAMTSPSITGPVRNCGPGGGSGVGCGGSSSSPSAFGGPAGAANGGNGVEVISQSVVGPYDTVTLHSTNPHALEDWLGVNGYDIPATFRPTIAAYVSEGSDFIALRLQPGQGVQAMQPVRVVTPGADVTLPLRMVAAGVGAKVGITLYVISEGRYEARTPFFNAAVNDSQLVWLVGQSRSNYQELAQGLMQSHNDHTWLTEYSSPSSVQASPTCANGPCTGFGGGAGVTYYGGQSLGDLYLAQCQRNPPYVCNGARAADGGSSPFTDDAASDAVAEAATDAGADAGCNSDPCAGFDDLDVALVGMHAQDTWVTRMRAILPASALSEGDLQIQASASQTSVSSQHSTNVYDDPTYSPCGTQGGCSANAEDPSPFGKWLVVGALGFVGAALARRRRRGITG